MSPPLPESFHLGFVSARSVYAGDDGLWADAGLGRLIDELGRRVPRLSLALSSVPRPPRLFDHRLELGREALSPLPFLPGVREALPLSAECRRVVRALEQECDALLVQLPFAAAPALLGPRRPRLYQVCADVLRQVRTSPYYRGLRRPPALLTAYAIDRLQHRLLRRPATRAVTHGRALRDHYGAPPGRWVISSALREREIASVARRRAGDAPFRVLFVGYLRHEKGFDVLLEAFEKLLAERPKAELEIVGTIDYKGSGVDEQLERGLAALDRAGRVRLAGAKSFGPELFERFADADVLVLPSRSEGTPRVLVEARAFGCPVVASRVGGVPDSVEDGVDGLLFPAGDAAALAERLIRLSADRELQVRLRTAGLERAPERTVEHLADELLQELVLLVGGDESAHDINHRSNEE